MKTLNKYLNEKLKVNKDYKNPIDVNEKIEKVFDFYKHLAYRNYGDDKIAILSGLPAMIQNIVSPVNNAHKFLKEFISNNFNKKIFEICDNCSKYLWWDEYELRPTKEIYGILKNFNKYSDTMNIYDALAIPVIDAHIRHLILEGYVNDNWAILLVFESTREYKLKGFVICKL